MIAAVCTRWFHGTCIASTSKTRDNRQILETRGDSHMLQIYNQKRETKNKKRGKYDDENKKRKGKEISEKRKKKTINKNLRGNKKNNNNNE